VVANVGRGRKKILYQHLQWTVACNLVEQAMSPCAREGVGEIIMGICKATKGSVLDTKNNQMIITIHSKGMIIGAPTTGKKVEGVEEDDFPEEEDALVGGEGAFLVLFIPTNKTLSKKVEMARQMPQLMLQLYPNHHLSQVISQAEEVLEVVVEVEAVADLLMEEEEVAEEVVQRWLNCYQPKLGLDLAQWMKDCLLLDK